MTCTSFGGLKLHCIAIATFSSLCLKKFPPIDSLQLCQILTDFQNLCMLESVMKFATKSLRRYPPPLKYVATPPLEINNLNFLRYSTDMKENANKLHFKCTDFNPSTRVTMHAECIYVLTEYLKYFSIRRDSRFLQCEHCEVCHCLATCQLCLCPATFSRAYEHHALSSFTRDIRLSTSLLCIPSNTNFLSKHCPCR